MSLDALPSELPALVAAVLLLGMRHGVDADHLATIDALTRLNMPLRPRLARRAGALFSLGHGAVVVAVASVVGAWLPEWQVPGWLISFGAWTSIACLIALAALNAASVLRTPRHGQARLAGLRSRWFGARHSTGALGIMGVGALFAVSFDTLSQAAMFALAGAAQRRPACGLAVRAGVPLLSP